jgi:hypothetical protein
MPVRSMPAVLPIRWSLVAASVLVLVAIVWLRRSEPSFADKLAPFVLDGRLEQRVEARNFAVKVKRIKLAEAYLTEGVGFDRTPRRVAGDGIWMSALVEVEPLQEPGYISAWLRTADGREFLAAPHDRPKVKGVNLGEQELASGLRASGAYFFDIPVEALQGAHLLFFWGLSNPGDMDHVVDIDLQLDAEALRKLRANAVPVIDLTP